MKPNLQMVGLALVISSFVTISTATAQQGMPPGYEQMLQQNQAEQRQLLQERNQRTQEFWHLMGREGACQAGDQAACRQVNNYLEQSLGAPSPERGNGSWWPFGN